MKYKNILGYFLRKHYSSKSYAEQFWLMMWRQRINEVNNVNQNLHQPFQCHPSECGRGYNDQLNSCSNDIRRSGRSCFNSRYFWATKGLRFHKLLCRNGSSYYSNNSYFEQNNLLSQPIIKYFLAVSLNNQ